MIISGWLLGIIGTCCWINFLKSFWSYLYVGIPTTPHMLCELNWMHYIWRMFLHFCHCYQKNILASHLLSLDCLLVGIMAYDYLPWYLFSHMSNIQKSYSLHAKKKVKNFHHSNMYLYICTRYRILYFKLTFHSVFPVQWIDVQCIQIHSHNFLKGSMELYPNCLLLIW